MADKNEKNLKNIPGIFYVDESCIDCDLCRSNAPEFFNRDDAGNGLSYVYRQPVTPEEIAAVEDALQECPSDSIGKDGMD